MRKSVWSKKGLQILALTGVLASLLVSGAFAEPPDPRPGEVKWMKVECHQATVAAQSGSDKRAQGWKLTVWVDGDEKKSDDWTDEHTLRTIDIPYDCGESHRLKARLDQHVCVVQLFGKCLLGRKKWKEGDPVSKTSSACEPWERVGEPKEGDWSCSGDKTTGFERWRDITEEDECFGSVRLVETESEPYFPCKNETERIGGEFCTECLEDEEGEWKRTCLFKEIEPLCGVVCSEETPESEECENCTVVTWDDARWSSAWVEDENGTWTRTLNQIARDKHSEEICGQDRQEHAECEFLEEVGEEYKIKEYGDWSCWSIEGGKWTRKRELIAVKDEHYDKECPAEKEQEEKEQKEEFKCDAKQLLEAANHYWAVEVPVGEGSSRLALIAGGTYPTGYKVFLEPYRDTLDDPPKLEFALWYIAPDEPTNEVRIPFVVSACFEVSESQWSQQIYIYDADHKDEPQQIDVQGVIQILPVQGGS